MAFGLSFAEEFFYGEDWEHKSDRPTSVAQALYSMPEDRWNEMCREVFDCDPEYVDVDTVMEKVWETDTCTDLTPPVEVWIDSEGYYRVEVYE